MKTNITFLAVLVALFYTGCKEQFQLDDPYQGVVIDSVYTVNVLDREAIADGISQIRVEVTFHSEAAPNSKVTFQSDAGAFSGLDGTEENSDRILEVKASGGLASAILKTSDIVNSNVGVQIKAGDFIRLEQVAFTRSYPEKLLLNATKYSMNANNSDYLDLEVDLRKAEGRVSQDAEIEVITIPSEAQHWVKLPTAYSDADQKASLRLVSIDTIDTNFLCFARMKVQDGSFLSSDTVRIKLTK